jgi:Thiolase, N-terminal domain
METPVILSGVRTPIGKFQGGLSGFSAIDLGAKAVAEAIRRSGLDAKQVDEAILGNVVQAGLGQNPARQAALKGWRRKRFSLAIPKSLSRAAWSQCPTVPTCCRKRAPGTGSATESSLTP